MHRSGFQLLLTCYVHCTQQCVYCSCRAHSIHTLCSEELVDFYVLFEAGVFYIFYAQVVCRVHSEGTVEEHRQFWVLVAGEELSWQVIT